jgi:hypothetical protein
MSSQIKVIPEMTHICTNKHGRNLNRLKRSQMTCVTTNLHSRGGGHRPCASEGGRLSSAAADREGEASTHARQRGQSGGS